MASDFAQENDYFRVRVRKKCKGKTKIFRVCNYGLNRGMDILLSCYKLHKKTIPCCPKFESVECFRSVTCHSETEVKMGLTPSKSHHFPPSGVYSGFTQVPLMVEVIDSVEALVLGLGLCSVVWRVQCLVLRVKVQFLSVVCDGVKVQHV